MLKNFGYDGSYRDENISVSVLLENPREHGFRSGTLVFGVRMRSVSNRIITLKLEDFTFYLMDETNSLYNLCCSSYIAEIQKEEEPAIIPNGLVYTNLQYEFLFQDLRIAFYYQPYGKINIIELKH